jgi:hypothetical protein
MVIYVGDCGLIVLWDRGEATHLLSCPGILASTPTVQTSLFSVAPQHRLIMDFDTRER